jgi:hypothetical protein
VIPPPSQTAWAGQFYGSITSGGEQSVQAVITADGSMRIHINDAWDDRLHPAGSAQFIGAFDKVEDQGLGSGILVGQECVAFPAGRFCAEPAPAQVRITTATRELFAGELQLETSEGEEVWPFEMFWSSWYSTRLESLEGAYRELRAEFAVDDMVIISVNSDGVLFFQGPASGCVGNGTLARHPEGPSSVFDAAVSIESCGGEFATLNGAYDGLAAHEPADFYYDAYLTLLLSTPGEAGPPTAMSLYGEGQ